MARYFNSLSDAVVASSRPIARARATAAAREAKVAARSSDTARAINNARAAVRQESDLVAAVERAADKLRDLQIRLQAARDRAGHLDDIAFRTGSVRSEALSVRAQLDGLPALIGRAEQELREAEATLARHRAVMAETSDDLVEVDPVDEPARGRGRPRKVAA